MSKLFVSILAVGMMTSAVPLAAHAIKGAIGNPLGAKLQPTAEALYAKEVAKCETGGCKNHPINVFHRIYPGWKFDGTSTTKDNNNSGAARWSARPVAPCTEILGLGTNLAQMEKARAACQKLYDDCIAGLKAKVTAGVAAAQKAAAAAAAKSTAKP